MSGLWIWLGTALLYAGFLAWYLNWRGRLTPDEIERFLSRLEGTAAAAKNDLGTLRTFLEQDDGRGFVMLNLVQLAPRPVPHPETGKPTRASRLLRGYLRGFLPVMLRHAGHPVLQAAKVGGYVDAWNVPPDPGWSFVGAMRYRSRRDMMELATHPRFVAAHPFKAAAMPATLSFPTAPRIALHVGPVIWVGLVLALGAALVHLASIGPP